MTIKRALIAADDALYYAQTNPSSSRTGRTSNKVAYKKFRKVVHLLGCLEKDFLSKDPTSDQNIGGTVSGEAKIDDRFNLKYALTVLSQLKKGLCAMVKFPFVSLPLNADES